MYQKRRLGAMNIEWRPSSLKFAIGPDISLDRDYQMLPLSDLDMIVDPLIEFVDVMEWEPKIEVLSDGNDSEYNVTEEYSMGEEQGSLLSSDGSKCSEEESEMEGTHKDGLRRSKRKRHKSEVEIMTSSRRHVKRKILDEFDANSFGHDRSKKSRNRKALQKKSSKSKLSRPQRAAACNALTLFSKIGTSSEVEDEDESKSDSSDIESMTQDLNTESDESNRHLQVEQMKHSKGKKVSLDEGENAARIIGGAEPHHAGNRTKLVLRLPSRGLNKLPSWDMSQQVCQSLHTLWSAPFHTVFAMILLYQQLGVASLLGALMLVLLFPIQTLVISRMQKLSKEGLQLTDGRIDLMNEILAAMDIVKYDNFEIKWSPTPFFSFKEL